jgi:hypothetical protein
MLRPWIVGALCLVWLAGCDLIEEGAEPSDCEAGNGSDCGGSSVDEGMGSVTVEVASSDDVFLLWVQSIPQSASVADNYITFSLDGMGGAVSGALTAGGSSSGQGLVQTRNAQLDYDGRRHAGVSRLVADMRIGQREVLPLMLPFSGVHPCETNEVQHEGSCVSTLNLNWGGETSREFQVQDYVQSGEHRIYVLVDSEDLAEAASARQAVEDFASTLGSEHAILGLEGHVGTLDHNADGAITVAFSNFAGAGIGRDVMGFFDYRDMLPSSDSEATGNEMDILWSRTPGASNPRVQAVATLAHEYAHLASFAVRVSGQGTSATQEALWLDEGIAHLMEDLLGWGPSNINVVEEALANWGDTALAGPVDGIANRGMAYLFLRHLVDTKAKLSGVTSADDAEVVAAAAAVIRPLMTSSASGFEHPSLAGISGTEHAQWLLGVFATGGSFLDAAHRADFLSPGTASTGYTTGIDPRGMFENAEGQSVPLDGPSTDDFDDLESVYEGEVLESGSLFLMLTDLEPGSHTIRGNADEGTYLQMHVEQVE